jgi:hypothetical protein
MFMQWQDKGLKRKIEKVRFTKGKRNTICWHTEGKTIRLYIFSWALTDGLPPAKLCRQGEPPTFGWGASRLGNHPLRHHATDNRIFGVRVFDQWRVAKAFFF